MLLLFHQSRQHAVDQMERALCYQCLQSNRHNYAWQPWKLVNSCHWNLEPEPISQNDIVKKKEILDRRAEMHGNKLRGASDDPMCSHCHTQANPSRIRRQGTHDTAFHWNLLSLNAIVNALEEQLVTMPFIAEERDGHEGERGHFLCSCRRRTAPYLPMVYRWPEGKLVYAHGRSTSSVDNNQYRVSGTRKHRRSYHRYDFRQCVTSAGGHFSIRFIHCLFDSWKQLGTGREWSEAYCWRGYCRTLFSSSLFSFLSSFNRCSVDEEARRGCAGERSFGHWPEGGWYSWE